jgi:predicted enzyme related to lactoylglutathione lyase
MPEITSYSPGTFSWADLTSPDQPASKAFYMALFDWDAVDNPIGEGVVYSQMLLRGKPVAAIAPNMPEQGDAPASWGAYVTVESADAAVDKARSLGATIGGDGAFDVFDVGRMAFLTDPQGSGVRVWEPRAHIGAEIVREPGSLAWFELSSNDPAAVAPFYAELFGWTVGGAPGMEDYLFATTAAGEGTGAIQATEGGGDTGWLVYFGTDDVDATLATARANGADELVPATDIPGDMGRFAIARDPQGAAFGLYRA